jgi:putative transposase
MLLVEQHIIRRHDSRWRMIDDASFSAKNLYNAANYVIRQTFFGEGVFINYSELDKKMQKTPEYRALPAKVSQWVLKDLTNNWIGFFQALKEWKVNPGAFLGRPKPPKYKHKTDGRFKLTYTIQAISKRILRMGIVRPSQLGIDIQTGIPVELIRQVRVCPRKHFYVLEVVYEVKERECNDTPRIVAGIDIGVDNLAAITSNKPGFVPILVNGRPLKSINQFYNKKMGSLQQEQTELGYPERRTRRMDSLTERRNRRVKQYMHCASRTIIDILCEQGVDTLIIGKNQQWKQSVKIGRRNNQNFVQIPHARFIDMLCYKAELEGIRVILQEESYSSKCSFLDLEEVRKHEKYLGRRVKRGLFKSSDGTRINADVNGSYNIIRKAFSNAFSENEIEGVVVRPVRIRLNAMRQTQKSNVNTCLLNC